MSRFRLALIVLLLVACQTASPATPQSGSPEPGLEVGNLAPDFSTQLLNGSFVSLKSLRGKVVLVNFWATWCGPCRSEMPLLQQLAAKQSANDFMILAIDNKESASVIVSFTEQLGLKFDVGLDPQGKIAESYTVHQYPTSYVIGRDGVILARQIGPFAVDTLQNAIAGWVKS